MEPTSPDGPPPLTQHPDEPHETFRERLRLAAEEAERQTGVREQTEEELQHSLTMRLVRIAAGFVIMAIGVAALPLPGPGWLIIIVGLNLLPFEWAERTIRLIRRRIPGVPEEGTVPVHTWVIMGTLTAAVTTVSLLWADDIGDWMRGLT